MSSVKSGTKHFGVHFKCDFYESTFLLTLELKSDLYDAPFFALFGVHLKRFAQIF